MSAEASYDLPAKLDLSAAGGLARDLLARRGAALTLNAAEVTHIGTPGLQVLLSARKTWEADGAPLSLTNFSALLDDQLTPMGLTRDDLTTGTAPSADGGSAAAGEVADGAADADGAANGDEAGSQPGAAQTHGTAPAVPPSPTLIETPDEE